MKYFLSFMVALVLVSAKPAFYAKPFASVYHFAASGNDATGDGSTGNPWQTVTKFNTVFATAAAGDQFLFNKGDEFAGGLNLSHSGSSGNPITIGAYGSGAVPIISGFTTVSSWVSVGSGRYEATVGSNSTINMVLLNGVFQPIGRWPKLTATNKGYLNVDSHSGTTSINSTGLSGALSYLGGEVVIRKVHWILDRGTVTAQSATSLSYSGGGYTPTDGNGFFLQNHPNACTVLGDWAYNGSTHKLTMFFGGSGPGGNIVKVSTVQNAITLSSRTDISFDHVSFQGANSFGASITGSSRIGFTDCDISYSGVDGINSNSSTNHVTLLRTTIERSNNNGIRSNNASDWIIQNSSFTNTGMIAGMGQSADGTYYCTSDIGNNSLIEYSSFINTGYVGISFNGSTANGNNIIIRYCLVNGFCSVKDDGAGIYTGAVGADVNHTKCYIQHCIVINGVGANEGAGGGTTYYQTQGIYGDNNTDNVDITDCTVANVKGGGIYLHDSKNVNLNNNTTYNSGNEELLISNESAETSPIQGVNLSGNILFNLTTSTNFFGAIVRSIHDDISTWGTWDNNYYCRPINSEAQFFFIRHQPGADAILNLAGWKSLSGKDVNSKNTGVAVTDVNKIRFEYNATASPATVSFPGTNYRDVRGAVYSGSITLQPYTSAVLIQTTTSNVSPTVSAGADRTITGTSVTLSGTSASDPDGSISSIAWSKIVGGAATITNGSTITPTFSGLAVGTYQFQVIVTDNGGATATDAMTVTVTGAANTAPTVNAGSDVTVTLPTASVQLSANGTDAEGAVTYLWSKVSGPAGSTISSTSSRTPTIAGLTQGTFVYRVTVTDAGSLTASDDVQITVNAITPPPANKPPMASAGPDITITLPVSSTVLNGSGTDQDGTISSYSWTYLSGPLTYNIVNPSSAQTTINQLGQGNYQFKLTVTDNSGAQTMDIAAIIVNPLVTPPVPGDHLPVSKAGNDIYVWLPATSTEMNGLVADFDGPVTALWTQTSGVAATIEHPDLVYTVVKGLREGTYEFELTATDNIGQTKKDRVKVFVRKCSLWYKIWGLCK